MPVLFMCKPNERRKELLILEFLISGASPVPIVSQSMQGTEAADGECIEGTDT